MYDKETSTNTASDMLKPANIWAFLLIKMTEIVKIDANQPINLSTNCCSSIGEVIQAVWLHVIL